MSSKRKQHVVKFTEVVECPLLPEMVETIKTLTTDKGSILDAYLELLQEGYAITVKLNEQKEGFSASGMMQKSGNPNAGRMVYANGPSPLGALAALVVKLDFLGLDTNWLEKVVEKQDSQYS